MRLKKVTLSNFKSYRGKTVVEIDDGNTIFVGHNGSGKSNFLQAIDFVLGSRNAVLRQTEKYRFLNNASASRKVYVEVVLQDDEDGIFHEELIVRRATSFQTDQYYLNNSAISRKEVNILLEVLGCSLPSIFSFMFSSQMKSFVTTNPKARFKSLVNSLGLSIERVVEYLQTVWSYMDDMRSKLGELDEVVIDLNPEEVEAALVNHKCYKSLKKMKSTILAVIHSHNVEKLKCKLEQEYRSLSCSSGRSDDHAKKLHDLKSSITTTKLALEKSKYEASTWTVTLTGLLSEKECLLRGEERTALKMMDLRDQIQIDLRNISIEREDAPRKGSSSDALYQERIDELTKMIEIAQAEVDALQIRLDKKEQDRNDLLLKHSCREKFSTPAGRKLWVDCETLKLNKNYEDNLEEIKNCEDSIEATKKEIVDCENKIETLSGDTGGPQNLHERQKLKHEISELQIELNKLQCNENVLLIEMDSKMKTLINKKFDLKSKIGTSTLNGFESTNKVIKSWNSSVQGSTFAAACYGTVLENIKCDSALNSAIDAAAGAQLFWQIVETDTIGTAILNEMKSKNMPGEVWFLPLNRVRPPQSPNIHVYEAKLLIDLLEYPPKVSKLMAYLFGRVILCRNLEIATEIAKTSSCICVTLEGDRVKGQGALSGGYVNPNSTTRTLHSAFREAEWSYQTLIASASDTKNQINLKKSAIDVAVSRLQQLKLRISRGDYKMAVRDLTKRLKDLRNDETRLFERKKSKERDNVLLRKRISLLQEEREESWDSVEVAELIQKLNKELIHINKKYNKQLSNLEELISRLDLMKTKVSCSNEIISHMTASTAKMKTLQHTLNDYQTKNSLLKARLNKIEDDIVLAKDRVMTNDVQVAKLKQTLEDLKQKLISFQSEKITDLNATTVRQRIVSYQETMKEEIRLMQLHMKNNKTLIAKFSGMIASELQQKLEDVNEELRKLNEVPRESRGALRRKVQMMKLKTSAQHRSCELDVFCKVYEELFTWIQPHVKLTLERVRELFNYFFNLMVPDGFATMEMQVDAVQEGKVLPISGTTLNLIFSGDSNISLPSVLSKGQQVVVLLSIVFALMKTQRLTLCIADEIDQSLTSNYIQGMLCAMSQIDDLQFLMSSHNKDLVSRGQHHFAVHFKQRSIMQKVSKSEAIEVLETIGDVSKRPSTSQVSNSQFSSSGSVTPQPFASQSSIGGSLTPQPFASQSSIGGSLTPQPSISQLTSGGSMTPQPFASQSSIGGSMTPQPSISQSSTGGSLTPQPSISQLTSGGSMTPQPFASQSSIGGSLTPQPSISQSTSGGSQSAFSRSESCNS